jgi:hypothetical protein
MTSNYFDGKIYKIMPSFSLDEEDICIGSTTEPLEDEFSEHVSNYFRIFKKYIYSSEKLFKKYGIENCKIELIENFPCNSIEVLYKRECEIIRKINSTNYK